MRDTELSGVLLTLRYIKGKKEDLTKETENFIIDYCFKVESLKFSRILI